MSKMMTKIYSLVLLGLLASPSFGSTDTDKENVFNPFNFPPKRLVTADVPTDEPSDWFVGTPVVAPEEDGSPKILGLLSGSGGIVAPQETTENINILTNPIGTLATLMQVGLKLLWQ